MNTYRITKLLLNKYAGLACVLTFGIFSNSGAVAQSSCGTDAYYESLKKLHPELVQKEADFNAQAKNFKALPSNRGTVKYIIPVVFHIFHTGGSENISRDQCLDALRLLNLDYSLSNTDTSQIRAPFKGLPANAEIEFRIAGKDPHGQCSEGVVRYYTQQTDYGNDATKLLSAWPSDRYLNIWVVRSIAPHGNTPGTILGYAQFPWAGLSRTDGVIVRADEVGMIGYSNRSNKNRVLTHEVGHWLGLIHTFQGGCEDGDYCDDTPPVNGTFVNANCPANGNSCTNDVPDLLDQWENYMDYSSGACQHMFTPQQKSRMHTALTVQRLVLFDTANLIKTGVWTSPGPCGPVAEFSADTRHICDNKPVQFTDMSYQGASVVKWDWVFEGGNPGTATTKNPAVTYAQPGVYGVSLIVENASGKKDTISRRLYVNVHAAAWQNAEALTESFEDGKLPKDWYYGGNTGEPWTISTSAAFSGTKSLKIANDGTLASGLMNVTTSQVDASGNSPSIEFKYSFVQRANSNNQPTQDKLSLKYSIDCGKTWSTIWAKTGSQLNTVPNTPTFLYDFVPPNSDYWGSATVSLSAINALSRRNMIFRWEFDSDGGNNLYLDQINLTQTLGNLEANKIGLTVSPNPASSNITVVASIPSKQNIQVSLVDISGREVSTLYNGEADGNFSKNFQIPSGVAAGVYTVRIQSLEGSFSQRIVIQ